MLYFDSSAIARLADTETLIDELRCAFAEAPASQPRSHFDLPGDDGEVLLLMPSWRDRRGLGVKLLTVAPGRPANGHASINGIYVLLDRETGEASALFDAAKLTLLRTAGVCALAASSLAPADARTMLMLGTGALAIPLIRAHAAVRPIDNVVVWGRDPAKAREVVRAVGPSELRVRVADDLEAHLAEADIICSATNSERPLILGRRVRAGAYVSLVGSFSPNMRESDDALLQRARLVVDTRHAVEESGDLIGPSQRGLLTTPVSDLHNLFEDRKTAVHSEERDLVVFKSVGTGLADLVAAEHVLRRYRSTSQFEAKILPVEIG